MKHQKQPSDLTCVHTCIAMLANIPVEEVVYFCGGDGGLSTKETMYALDHFNCSWNLMVFPTLMWGCWHLVTVPSLNEASGNHAILIGMDVGEVGIKVMDPQKGRKGRKAYTPKTLGGWSEAFIITGV